MCFKIKFPANPFKSLIYRSCYRPTRYSHIVCNFLMGLSKNKLLMDEVTLFICQNSQHRMNNFILNNLFQHIDRAVSNLTPVLR